MERKEQVSLRDVSSFVGISMSVAWKIMRKHLAYKPYKPKSVAPLTAKHISDRIRFCTWLLEQPVDFANRCLWSDEKWFHLKQHPNKQNERYWAPFDPEIETECRVQGGEKVMCWAGIVKEKLIIHWFEEGISVNSNTYLSMLKEVVWPKVRYAVNRDQIYFQQDGARVHTTPDVREWLDSKFNGRVISDKMDIQWPARSPDLSPLDHWFWGVAIAELQKCRPSNLDELKLVVEGLAESLDQDEISRGVQHIRRRAQVCLDAGGRRFEHKLRKSSSGFGGPDV